ncbi:MAG: hypothetical protein QXO01_05015 [Nitrososphaerota archaeon]
MWEETEEYIRSGHKNADEFEPDSFRTIDIDADAGIKAIVAKPKGKDTTEVVSYLFSKEKGWTLEKAKEWFEARISAVGGESFSWASGVFRLCKDLAESKDAKVWKVKALHVGKTRNNTLFTEEELRAAARSLAMRPVSINHSRMLPFPENAVIAADYEDKAVEALVLISDPDINRMIESGEISGASVEWIARDAYPVNGVKPHGLVFTGLGLLTKDVEPGDPLARITKEKPTTAKVNYELPMRSPAARAILAKYGRKLR